ncbi:MAG: hypothetical protein Q7R85_03290 [bacterium]|nr:hypothetical protein [bacterium]
MSKEMPKGLEEQLPQEVGVADWDIQYLQTQQERLEALTEQLAKAQDEKEQRELTAQVEQLRSTIEQKKGVVEHRLGSEE